MIAQPTGNAALPFRRRTYVLHVTLRIINNINAPLFSGIQYSAHSRERPTWFFHECIVKLLYCDLIFILIHLIPYIGMNFDAHHGLPR